MGKIVNINGIKMMMDDEGNLHPIPKKYFDANEAKSNNFALKRPKKREKVSMIGDVCSAINDKSGGKCNKVTRVVMNENTLKYLLEHPDIQKEVYDLYGLHTVEHVMNRDFEDNIIYIHYADMRYKVICVGKELKKKKHFAEKLLGGNYEI